MNDCRKLAFQLAIKNNLNVPESWKLEQSATLAWMKSFRKRFPELSLRIPEGCSLGRASGFNKTNVNIFFDKLEEAMNRHPDFGNGTRLFNLD